MAHRRLLIISPERELPSWTLGGYDITRVASGDQGLVELSRQGFEAVVLVVKGKGEGTAELCARISALGHDDVTPVALAAGSDDPLATRLLGEFPFDAFLDLRWDGPLAEQCLDGALTRARAGHNLIEIQQSILLAVRGDVAALQTLAVRDELTGLYNLHHFREVAGKEHRRCHRHQRPYAVVFLDLDNLKSLNSAHGHAAGARALVKVGSTLAAVTRSCDYVFRVGGDEFVALIVESSAAQAAVYADRVCRAVERLRYREGEHEVRLTVSAGVAAFPGDGESTDELLKNADVALYRAKALGKNRVSCYGPPPVETST